MKKKLKIEKIVHKGFGLARDKKKVYFIPYTIENEEVSIRVAQVKKNYIYALPEKISQPSPYRVIPKCTHFQVCGGCDFQHIDYTHQSIIKKNIIKEFLRRQNIFLKKEINYISSPQSYHYRINARFHIKNERFGYFKKISHKLVGIKECPVMDDNIMNFIKPIKDFHLLNTVKIKTDNNNNISSNIMKNRLQYSVDDLDIYYDFRAFFQSNKFLIEKWLEEIVDFISDFNKKRIIELYCGTGIISLFLTKQFKINRITGIDKDNALINFARISRERNRLFKVKFIAGKVEKAIEEFQFANIIIMNPPRQGLSEDAVNKIVKLKAEAIIYSSCEISTFFRDAEKIIYHGYKLERLTGLDIFPQTYHFEIVGLFILE